MDIVKTQRPLALVTGASSGIGLELARVLAAHGHDLLLVARRANLLQKMAQELELTYGGRAEVLTLDLSQPGAAERVVAELQARGRTVDVLVNNAGFSQHGLVAELPLDRLQAIVQVNVLALMDLTRLILPGMLTRKQGRVMNVASVVSFTPAPYAAVYAATKAFVLSFSEALAEELRDTGITVTALCPGTTATEFATTSGMTDTLAFRSGSMPAKTVAEIGYQGMMRGKTIVIPGWMNRLTVFSLRLSPRSLVAKIAKKLMSQAK